MKRFCLEPWEVVYNVEEGARLNALRYNEYDLLTSENAQCATSLKYGLYETRPVYGYDDCFPSVDTSLFPGTEWTIPDHGELCWLKWMAEEQPDGILFEVRSKKMPVYFRRHMTFQNNKIAWKFSVENESGHTIYFQHIMHSLLKLSEIKKIEFPEFQKIFNETAGCELKAADPQGLQQYLLRCPPGKAEMIYAHGISEGRMSWTYINGLRIESVFSNNVFPTIGIWWNNSGYPDEEGLRRNECAFEPIPGINSKLYDNYLNGTCLSVGPDEIKNWHVEWNVIDAV